MTAVLKNFNQSVFDTAKAINEGKNIIVHQGGTSSGKTFSILQFIIIYSLKHENQLTSIVAETMPHLRRGAMRDFFNILNAAGLYSEKDHNKTENIYKIGSSIIEFFSADSPDKLRGPRRNNLFLNECNNITYDAYDQLHIRTKGWEILDFNPTSEFWVHEYVLKNQNVAFFKTTYLNNKFLDKKIIDSIEEKKNNPKFENWWRVFGLGEIGQSGGLIYPVFETCEQMPEGQYYYGLDFGYSNDETALVQVTKINNKIYCNELIYETGLLNKDIIARLKSLNVGKNIIIADSAEMKTIDEIALAGFNIKPCTKGKDSIMFGIQLVNQFDLVVTKRSLNLIKELRNYAYQKNKDGNYINYPIDYYNHSLDALRYVVVAQYEPKKPSFVGHKVFR